MASTNPPEQPDHDAMTIEADESFRSSYHLHAAQYGVQYWMAGRYALAAGLSPVCATLMHHAAEMLMKSALSVGDTADQIRKYGRHTSYGHKLDKLWTDIQVRRPELHLVQHDDLVRELDKFEDIRYPETLGTEGAAIMIGLTDPPTEPPADPRATLRMRPERTFGLYLPPIDRLMSALLVGTGINRNIFEYLLDQERARIYFPDLIRGPLPP